MYHSKRVSRQSTIKISSWEIFQRTTVIMNQQYRAVQGTLTTLKTQLTSSFDLHECFIKFIKSEKIKISSMLQRRTQPRTTITGLRIKKFPRTFITSRRLTQKLLKSPVFFWNIINGTVRFSIRCQERIRSASVL